MVTRSLPLQVPTSSPKWDNTSAEEIGCATLGKTRNAGANGLQLPARPKLIFCKAHQHMRYKPLAACDESSCIRLKSS